MSELVTIWSFSYQHQMLTVRAQMEAEGIETFTGDELTIQIDPLYSNAIGGIKLMVHEQDVPRATEILAESGYVKKDERKTEQLLQKLLRYIDDLPFFRNLNSEQRFFAITAITVILLAFIIYLLTLCI